MLNITIVNISDRPVCFRAEVIKNNAYEMELWLRDSKKRKLRYRDPGFLLPPDAQTVRLIPGEKAHAYYDLSARFRLPAAKLGSAQTMQAKAGFRYDYCDGSMKMRTVSSWQSI